MADDRPVQPENTKLGAFYDVAPVGNRPAALSPAIVINVQRQPGANVITTVDSIKQALPRTHGQPSGGSQGDQ